MVYILLLLFDYSIPIWWIKRDAGNQQQQHLLPLSRSQKKLMLCAEVNAEQHRRLRPHPLCDGCLDDPNSVSVGGHGDQKDDTEEEFSFIIIKPSIPPSSLL